MEENQQRKGIKFGDNFIMSFDGLNIVLDEYGEKINKKTKEKTYGLKKTTYHRTLEQAFNHLLNRKCYCLDTDDIKDIIKMLKEFRNDFIKFRKIIKVVGNEIIETK